MRTYFLSQGLQEIIENVVTILKNTSTLLKMELAKFNAIKENDWKVLYDIQLALTNPILPRISGAISAKQPWDTLKKEYNPLQFFKLV